MHVCSPKTMLKIGIIIGAVLLAGWLLVPQARPVLIGIAPLALFVLCPLAMVFGMRGMNMKGTHSAGAESTGEQCTSCGASHPVKVPHSSHS